MNNIPSVFSKSDAKLFLKEFWARLFAKTPRFFRVIGNISLIMAGIGAIPDVLEYLDITVPDRHLKLLGHLLKAAGAWGKLMSLMGVSTPSFKTVPFTFKKNIEQEIKKERNPLPDFDSPPPPPPDKTFLNK